MIFIFVCTYDNHENEPIIGFCMNLKCKEQQKMCSNCLIDKHQDHKQDFKSLNSIPQFIVKSSSKVLEWKTKVKEFFNTLNKVQKNIFKFLDEEKQVLIELQKQINEKQVTSLDILKLKFWNCIIQSNITKEEGNFRLILQFFNVLTKISVFLKFMLPNIPEFKIQNDTSEYVKFRKKLNEFKNHCFEKTQNFNSIIETQTQILHLWQFNLNNALFIATQIFKNLQDYLESQNQNLILLEKYQQEQQYRQFSDALSNYKQFQNTMQYLIQKVNYGIINQILQQLFKFHEALKNMKQKCIQISDVSLGDENHEPVQMEDLTQTKNLRSYAYYNKGVALVKYNYLKNAIISFDQAIKLDPNNFSAIYYKGIVLSIKHQYSEALACYKQVLNFNPNLSYAYNDIGNALFEQQKYKEAVTFFDHSISLDPKNATVLMNKGMYKGNLGNALLKIGDFNNAIICYEQANKFDPNNLEILQLLGNALCLISHYRKAIFYYNQAIDLNPNDPELFYRKGNALGEIKELGLATECYNQALNIHLKKGKMLMKRKFYKEAVSCFDKALEYNPYNVVLLRKKGNALTELGLNEDAIKCYDKVLNLNANDLKSLMKKGAALFSLRFFPQAIKCFEKVIQEDPKQSKALFCKGKALAQLGLHSYALIFYKKAIQINPNNCLYYECKYESVKILGFNEEADKCEKQIKQIKDFQQQNKQKSYRYLK